MADTQEHYHSDPGLQPERTSLAWTRTTVALMVASTVLLRWAHLYGPYIVGVSIFLMCTAATVLLTQRKRYVRSAKGLGHEQVTPNVMAVVLLTAAMVLFGGAAIVFVLIEALNR